MWEWKWTKKENDANRITATEMKFIITVAKNTGMDCRRDEDELTEHTLNQGRGVHVTGVSAAYTFKLNKNIISV
jgi:hypothetical protein